VQALTPDPDGLTLGQEGLAPVKPLSPVQKSLRLSACCSTAHSQQEKQKGRTLLCVCKIGFWFSGDL